MVNLHQLKWIVQWLAIGNVCTLNCAQQNVRNVKMNNTHATNV